MSQSIKEFIHNDFYGEVFIVSKFASKYRIDIYDSEMQMINTIPYNKMPEQSDFEFELKRLNQE